YFTGVRPVVVPDIAPVQAAVVEQKPFDAGATHIFSPQSARVGIPKPQAREAGSRKLPQWVFLGHFFTDAILADRPATAVTQRNVKINVVRRILLGAAAAFAIFMAVWWAVSFSNNRALIANAAEAARSVPAVNLPPGQLAPADSLTRLTRVKDTLAVLNRYAANGEPMGYDAFLYAGNEIREPLNRTYYALFRRLLLGPTQQTLASICTNPQNYDAQGYRYVYDALKAYLITTDHHEKSTPEYLVPVLVEHWQNGQQASPAQQDPARQNFDFYAAGLAASNPYPRFAAPDSNAVENARAYFQRFAQEERIYQAMLLAAGSGQKPIVFNTDFPGSAATVVNKYRVDPAFTKNGYAAFFKELRDPDRYFAGEEWVLGKQAFAAYDKQKLTQDLTQRYKEQFQNTWRDYLKATAVVSYASVHDAASKLARISSPQSPLLEALCVASENTAVPDKQVAAAFQPVQFVTPQGCSTKLVGPSNNGYMQNLIGLASSLQAAGSSAPPDPNNINAANAAATQAENAVSTLALNFANDPADAKSGVLTKTSEILREPIARVPPLLAGALKNAAAGPINAAAAGTCAAIAPMLREYPFNPRSTSDAT
ncbi:MAG: ImcF-related family protein, partial [Bryobacteraceae bacterium]